MQLATGLNVVVLSGRGGEVVLSSGLGLVLCPFVCTYLIGSGRVCIAFVPGSDSVVRIGLSCVEGDNILLISVLAKGEVLLEHL